ncbi:fungal-specific transcription factor domain-containing protein [Xylariomycetidae sp. FL2044]|nr:fungal-specific transcription factor domain-containing protein [Xylariomycetidae sp. FL2044]
MPPPQSPGQANQACQRCYKRKKRCDRNLPRCGPCVQAGVRCSFAERQDETGIYPVSYVTRLQHRVKQLEHELRRYQLAIVDAAQSQSQKPTDRTVPGPTGPFTPGPGVSSSPAAGSTVQGQNGTPDNLETGVQLLSLEAVAERYLGPSSSVTFARLTQAVLKRLNPDLQPFSFTDSNSPVTDGALPQEASIENDASPLSPQTAPLPPKKDAYRLSEFYWRHSHTLYPFLRRGLFMENLKKMYEEPPDQTLLKSDSWLYTMWMVFAIGSTSLSSILLSDESESVQYWKNAMNHFDQTLQGQDMTGLTSILLQVSYSFFNQVGPNTWYLIGMGIRLAQGMGLHAKPTTNPPPKPIQEHRSRVFFSLYMMDRLVSVTLGRPFGMRDEDIEIDCFSAADDADILSDRILPHRPLTLPLITVPLHILSLRKLAGDIFREVYSNRNAHLPQEEKNEIVRNLHERIIEWRRTMPFPLPDCRPLRVPQLTPSWYDLNYHNHVIMLYRPSPLCPVITVDKLTVLTDAAASALHHAATMRNNQCFSFNWLNLFSLFTTTLALIYAVTVQPQPLSDCLRQSDALENLRLAADLLGSFGRKFPSAQRYKSMVQEVIQGLEAHKPGPIHLSPAPSSLELSISEERQHRQPPDTSSPSGESSYPSHATGNAEYDNLQSQLQVPPAFQLNSTNGLFDDFAAHDLVAGFDMSGVTGDHDGFSVRFLGADFAMETDH